MSRNDAESFAERLYARVPGHYRVYDREQGYPLRALLRVVGEQAANLRQDLDALWDNFFIETCDDWVVPYLGALVGANLLAQPVGQSNRLDVKNTVFWRRTKGSPSMLESLARAITGWPVDLVEFFQILGWTQNLNHLRLDRPVNAAVRDPYHLSLVGTARDVLAHSAEFKPQGRYEIKKLGFFARRLRTFRVSGVTPAGAPPGAPVPPATPCYSLDPLFRDMPLFRDDTGERITRAALAHNPWEFFDRHLAVRQFGVLLASEVAPQLKFSSSRTLFDFGGAGAGLQLHSTAGMRLLNPADFSNGTPNFVIAAEWHGGGPPVTLGSVATLTQAYQDGSSASGPGQLALSVRTGPSAFGGRFPGAVIAVRARRSGPPRQTDALLAYLPAGYIETGSARVFYVADDGATYTDAGMTAETLARSSEGQVYPPRLVAPSTVPAGAFTALTRTEGGMRLPDPSRFGGAQVLIEAGLFTGTFQPLGKVATVNQSDGPAFTYVPSTAALNDTAPVEGLLSIRITPLAGSFLPAVELIVMNRAQQSLLIYLPEIDNAPVQGVDLFVAEDGSTYFADETPGRVSLSGLALARAATGQVLPLPDTLPLEYRRPVSANLCRCERSALLHPGELGIDPELGRFAFAPGDPAIGQGNLTVDYVEAFSERVGALNYDRRLDPHTATRYVSRTGDGPAAPVHATLSAALAAAQDGDIIEIVDSATYVENAVVALAAPSIRTLTLRAAAGQRPCIYLDGGLDVLTAMERLELDGLLVSGGAIRIQSPVNSLYMTACTLPPLFATDADLNTRADYVLCRCIVPRLRLAPGVGRITLADSIAGEPGELAIGGAVGLSSPPSPDPPAATVQLERVTVFGRVRCDVLNASECLLEDLVTVEDQQAGCVRFTRYQPGSVLPRRFQCVTASPLFLSRRLGKPEFARLSDAAPAELFAASEDRAEIGAFATALDPVRQKNLFIKLREFMPVGLTAVLIAET